MSRALVARLEMMLANGEPFTEAFEREILAAKLDLARCEADAALTDDARRAAWVRLSVSVSDLMQHYLGSKANSDDEIKERMKTFEIRGSRVLAEAQYQIALIDAGNTP